MLSVRATKLFVIMFVLLIVSTAACRTANDTKINNQSPSASGEGFAIYLTEPDVAPDRMEMLSHVDIAEQPLISVHDIVSYNIRTHEIILTDEAFERIADLEVSLNGKSFLVCVDSAPVYWGAFWTPISSFSFDGVVIIQPLSSAEPNMIKLALGYPSSSFYSGEDPRSNQILVLSLEGAGKLVNYLSDDAVFKLPQSFKGYELYSWEENGQWHFTLINGTNRTKTEQEITYVDNAVSEDGWVKIHVAGAGAVKNVLASLPAAESIYWCDELHIGGATGMDFELPPEEITKSIQEYAELCGLDFHLSCEVNEN
jgi:hypothetical protein